MNRSCALYALAAAFSLLPATVSAQDVMVRVRGPASDPVFGALTYLVGASGATVKSALTRAYRKLGVSTRVELARLVGAA